MRFMENLTAVSALFAVASASPLVDKRLKSGPQAYASVFAKYGKEPPATVKAAAANNDGICAGSSRPSSPPIKLTVKISMTHQSPIPPKKLTGATWNITYGDGSFSSGIVYTDTASVGSPTFKNQAVELAQEVSEQFQQDINNDGLLGLAFSSINMVWPEQQLTFFDNVKSSLSGPLFAVNFKKGEPGTYAFGTTDESAYTGEITYFDVDSSQGFWTFPTSGYAVGDGDVNDNSVEGIADTGTTLLLIDDDVVADHYRAIPGAK